MTLKQTIPTPEKLTKRLTKITNTKDDSWKKEGYLQLKMMVTSQRHFNLVYSS